MANYSLNRSVYDKEAYKKTIDTSFSQIAPPPPPQNTISVEQFFSYYSTIFYDIPTSGNTNSHEYLVKTSGDYIGSSNINEDVQLLLDEITLLRQELLLANQQVLQLQISSSMI